MKMTSIYSLVVLHCLFFSHFGLLNAISLSSITKNGPLVGSIDVFDDPFREALQLLKNHAINSFNISQFDSESISPKRAAASQVHFSSACLIFIDVI
jgi:hypothetical protein